MTIEAVSITNEFDPVLARQWIEYYTFGASTFTNTHIERHCAFASSVLSLTRARTWSPQGFPNGPTVRAYAVDLHLAGPNGQVTKKRYGKDEPEVISFIPDGTQKSFGEWAEEDAMHVASTYCYADFTKVPEELLDIMKMLWVESQHFDDDPEDVELFERLTGVKARYAPPFESSKVFHTVYYDEVDERWLRPTPRQRGFK